MRDPYEILELKKGANKDDVKRAYKKLAKQYHPDQYDDNPLRILAEDKMREINEAYDYLMKSTPDNASYGTSNNSSYANNNSYGNNSKNQSNSGYSNGNSNYNGYSNSNNNSNNNQNSNYNQNNYNNSYSGGNSVNVFSQVRGDINSGNLRAAEDRLNSVRTRDAEWNYLMGILFSKKGWYDSARNYITTAYNMNPSNIEYRNAYNQLNMNNHSYRQNYYGRRSNDVDMCNLCTNLWCADTLCECFGGDLISCM